VGAEPLVTPGGQLCTPVKMVIWDLDETLWAGTLSEGPVELHPDRIEVVRALNQRGIVNSICSKNDREAVRERLDEAGIWDEFVFASIEWTPKGARVVQVIADAQLRPENVLFIDDLPVNLEEARHASPGIQTAGPEIIDHLLGLSEVRGKEDHDLSRLRQYQLLERKQADRASEPAGNEEFLRSCAIRIGLFEDGSDEAGRLFELANRTNQLNFTKRRLDEQAFRELLADPTRRTGYVRVRDRYGDYGICGFFALAPGGSRLTDFLFSCRILHMGVEQWVYRQIGQPAVDVVGDVASRLDDPVDWIAEDIAGFEPLVGADGGGDATAPAPDAGRVLMVGGCDLIAVAQYLGGDILTDFSRNGPTGALIHIEHTDLLRQAAHGLTEEKAAILDRLPFIDRQVFDPAVLREQFDVLVYSVLMDYTQGRYRHRRTGLVIPWHQHDQDVTDPSQWPAVVAKFGNVGVDTEFLRRFADEFEAIGPLQVGAFTENVRWLASNVCRGRPLILLNGAEVPIEHAVERQRHLRHRTMNAALDALVAQLPVATVCDVRLIVRNEADLSGDIRHYRRHVYKRIAEQILASGATTLRRKRPARKDRMLRKARGFARRRRRDLRKARAWLSAAVPPQLGAWVRTGQPGDGDQHR
jgi:FkbH-like protein